MADLNFVPYCLMTPSQSHGFYFKFEFFFVVRASFNTSNTHTNWVMKNSQIESNSRMTRHKKCPFEMHLIEDDYFNSTTFKKPSLQATNHPPPTGSHSTPVESAEFIDYRSKMANNLTNLCLFSF